MPEKRTIERARRDRREGKAPTTQAGEFVREEMEHIRRGKHGARSSKQAIAIGLSKARRAGVDLPPPEKGAASERTRRSATRDYARGHGSQRRRKASAKRTRATTQALKREGRGAASHRSLSRQARAAARRRSRTERSGAARKAAGTRGRTRTSASTSSRGGSRRTGARGPSARSPSLRS
ncbi:MAG: DNA-binding protein [Steroidobacteraceae bacterium]|nr:DNA-binding protein [Steroidobacteraceae bacterium]